jgi:hypothetical protein
MYLDNNGKFSIKKFFSRYLSGGGSLDIYRDVSRKRLFLSHSPKNSSDLYSDRLLSKMNSYQRAVEFIKKEQVSIDALMEAHRLLNPHEKSFGRIRTSESVVAGKTKYPYFPPSPKELHGLRCFSTELSKKTVLSNRRITLNFLNIGGI